jgi:hypothetical protein
MARRYNQTFAKAIDPILFYASNHVGVHQGKRVEELQKLWDSGTSGASKALRSSALEPPKHGKSSGGRPGFLMLWPRGYAPYGVVLLNNG